MGKDKGKASADDNGDWWERWRAHTRRIRAALLAAESEQEVRDLLAAFLADYATHVGAATTEEVLAIVSGGMHSPLEAAFLWLGGWRPTAAIELVYSIMGVQMNEETQQPALGPQVIHCMPVLSERQLSRITSLQIQSRRVEADISDRLAVIQMLIPDEELVAALNLGASPVSGKRNLPQARQLVHSKLMNMRELFMEADQLRLQTLQELFLLLTAVQGARCCLAGYELLFALKTLGNSPLVQFSTMPPAAIPVPVPVLVAQASTSSVPVLPPEVLPLLVPSKVAASLSLPPLSPVPIPLIVTRLRTIESLTEAQIFSNTLLLVVDQQTRAPDPAPTQNVDSPISRQGCSAELPSTFQAQASEVSIPASVCSAVPCPDPIVLTTAVETSVVASESFAIQFTGPPGVVHEDEGCPGLGSLGQLSNLDGEFGVGTNLRLSPEIVPTTDGTNLRSLVGREDEQDLWQRVETMSLSDPSAELASSSTIWHGPYDSRRTDTGREDCNHPP